MCLAFFQFYVALRLTSTMLRFPVFASPLDLVALFALFAFENTNMHIKDRHQWMIMKACQACCAS